MQGLARTAVAVLPNIASALYFARCAVHKIPYTTYYLR
jgi:hypothetical protein